MFLAKPTAVTHQNSLKTLYNIVNKTTASMAAIKPKFPNTLNLPSLPVPSLEQTADKYLKSVIPFLSTSELQKTKELLEKFKDEAKPLQQLLVKRAQSTENWLDDWWLNVAYLEYRDPVTVFSSPGLVFPFEEFETENDRLAYTAKLILGACDYKLAIDNNAIPLDKMGKDPLDMNQYKKIFGTCRIPQEKRDGLEFHSDSKHIVVVRNNNFFKMDVLSTNGQLPSYGQVIRQLEEILQQSEEPGLPVGILSADHRDHWAKSYANLLKASPDNENSIKEIQSALFLVCLDNPMPGNDGNRRSLASKQFIHGGGSRANSGNRWFDKTVQFVIGVDGTVGLTYEHSPSEGQPIAVMTDYVVDYTKKSNISLPDINIDFLPTKLPFKADEAVNRDIHAASTRIDDLADNLELDSFKFEDYGKEFVKTQKMSPDSFIQIAMQYAFYKIHKSPGAHYESAATRKYIHGRTETIRSCSIESIAFAQAMLSRSSDGDKVKALKDAVNSHKKYSVEAVNGFGVDRHLLGLKLTSIENGLPLPELYKDVSYSRSTHMRLSTSQVATNCDGFMVYGPLTNDGYGCCYNPRKNDINFGLSAFVNNNETSASNYRNTLTQCLREMHDVLAKTQKSKL